MSVPSLSFITALLLWSENALAHATGMPCADLKTSLKIPNVTITDATQVTPGTNLTTGLCFSLGHFTDTISVTAPLCRVQFVVNTTSTSAVHAEAWLPDEWYGRFLALGNGDLAGCMDYLNLDYGSSMHFATVESDAGHVGEGGAAFLNAPEVVKDFASRAIHVETAVGKQIVNAYYGSKHGKSYYLGCSTGGQQGAKAAVTFPEDFDGILAGSPATDFNHLLGWSGILSLYSLPNTTTVLTPDQWTLVSAEILKQCDMLDGVKDGIITEPDLCKFNPAPLQCLAANSTNCLTAPQVQTLSKIYSPLVDSEGRLVYPRYDPGAEADGGWQDVFGGSLLSLTNDWWKDAVYNDSNHDLSDFGLKDIAAADAVNPGGIGGLPSDFAAFYARGGKFMSYHGRRDQEIPAGNSKRMYQLVAKTLKMNSLDPFYRLFLIPGMNHCGLGPGASKFGQLFQSSNLVNDTTHNILLAMVDWVEQGVAPDTIIGSTAEGAQRTHCRYPQRSVWNGTEFVCVK